MTPVGTTPRGLVSWRDNPSKLSVVMAVARRMVPYLIEATLIPTAIFYTFLLTLGLRSAIVATLGYAYASVARRLLGHQPVPGLLVLATLGISVRATIYFFNDNAFVYFAQPILRTVVTAAFFAASALLGRPLIARFAADFCPISPEIEARPAVARLFRRLTYLWAGVNAAMAAASLALLLTVPVAVFVAAAAVSAWAITCSGVVLTVSDSVRTARSEGLATAVGSNGTLRAYLAVPA